MAGGYPSPPHEPPGGWKNDAQWIGNVQKWSEDMIRMGFGLKDVMKIYQDDIGEPFPKNLKNTIEGNDWLFPGQDAMYEYDLQNHKKKHFTYNDPEHPGQQKGPFQWEDMSPSEMASADQYYNWRNDEKNAWMFGATPDNPEGHPYQAWLQQWGDRWKDPSWTPPKASGQRVATGDIFKRPGYDASGRKTGNLQITKPITPLTPGGNGNVPIPPISPTPVTPSSVSGAQTSIPNLTGYGITLPKPNDNINANSVNPSGLGWGNQGLNPRRRKINTSSANNPYFTF